MQHFADRVEQACRAKGNSVWAWTRGWELLPLDIRQRHGDGSPAAAALAFEEFCLAVLDVVASLVPVVKPQSAFFEACGPAGMSALQKVLARVRQLGLITILDSKRNDIASTAQAYAEAVFGGVNKEGSLPPLAGKRHDRESVPGPRCRGTVPGLCPPVPGRHLRAGADQQPGSRPFSGPCLRP